MDYLKIYNNFIADRKSKEPTYLNGLRYMSVRTKLRRMFGDKQGLETHHIVPSYKGGTDDPTNVVTLTVREHIFVHMLYAKAYPNDAKAWASLWATVGMPRKDRSLKTALQNKWAYVNARKEMASSCVGKKSAVANLTVYEWVHATTGEEFTGTRHDLVEKAGHNNTARWETMDYFRGVVLKTRSGWFDKSRFASIDALNMHIEKNKEITKKANRRKTGKLNSSSKKVICIDTGIIYDSQSEAADKTGAHKSKISECCTGSRKKAGGYRWAYANEMKEAA